MFNQEFNTCDWWYRVACLKNPNEENEEEEKEIVQEENDESTLYNASKTEMQADEIEDTSEIEQINASSYSGDALEDQPSVEFGARILTDEVTPDKNSLGSSNTRKSDPRNRNILGNHKIFQHCSKSIKFVVRIRIIYHFKCLK